MYEPQLDQVIQQDLHRVKNDVTSLKEDGINKISEVAKDLDHSKEDVVTWVNNGVSNLSSGFEKVKEDVKNTVAHASTALMKNVGNGLGQYNAKATEVVNKLPGGVGEKAVEYPWVSISVALMAGFLLRSLFMPRRR